MGFYEDMREIATELFTEFNQAKLEYIRMAVPSGVGVDPASPGEPVPTPFDIMGTARGVSSKFILNGTAIASDLQVNCAVFAVEPDMNGFIDITPVGGVVSRHKIVHIERKPASGPAVAYSFVIRKV